MIFLFGICTTLSLVTAYLTQGQIKAKGKSKTQELKPAYNDPGTYHSIFYPTLSTQYQYRIFGALNKLPIDLTFTCSFDKHDHDHMDDKALKVSDKVIRKQKKGAFGCPLDKTTFKFP